MNDLETLSKQFKDWRGDRRYYRYPKHFWDEIRQLAKHYTIADIAVAFGISHQYLKQKIHNDSSPMSFASLNVTSPQLNASVEFVDNNARTMTVRFQADPEFIIHMIQSLSGSKQ
jgi:hypothetical protein